MPTRNPQRVKTKALGTTRRTYVRFLRSYGFGSYSGRLFQESVTTTLPWTNSHSIVS